VKKSKKDLKKLRNSEKKFFFSLFLFVFKNSEKKDPFFLLFFNQSEAT
jgi:hypothetical protein